MQNKEHLTELREAFDLFDRNKVGRITDEDLKTVMESLRLQPSEAEIKNMISQADIDGNGSIDFNEFVLMMTSHVKTRNDVSDDVKRYRLETEVRQAFKVFDIDGDGLIDGQELKLTMMNLGEVLTDQDVKAMIRAADKNDDGKIDFEGRSDRKRN